MDFRKCNVAKGNRRGTIVSRKMECQVINGTKSEAEEYAMQWANRGHGKKPDERTKERRVRWHLAHEKWQHFTDHHIAYLCDCVESFVRRIRTEVQVRTSAYLDAPLILGLSVDLTKKWRKIAERGETPRLYFKGEKLCLTSVLPQAPEGNQADAE